MNVRWTFRAATDRAAARIRIPSGGANKKSEYPSVAQLDNAADSDSEGGAGAVVNERPVDVQSRD